MRQVPDMSLSNNALSFRKAEKNKPPPPPPTTKKTLSWLMRKSILKISKNTSSQVTAALTDILLFILRKIRGSPIFQEILLIALSLSESSLFPLCCCLQSSCIHSYSLLLNRQLRTKQIPNAGVFGSMPLTPNIIHQCSHAWGYLPANSQCRRHTPWQMESPNFSPNDVLTLNLQDLAFSLLHGAGFIFQTLPF